MPAILPLAPSAALTPDGLLAPSSSTTYLDAPAGALPLTGSATDLYGIPIEYIDAPVGHIGGTLVVGGGGIVKVGGSSVNQQPERKPRTYPQQQPPRLIHIEYQAGHDAPTGTFRLAGMVSETFVPPPTYRIHAGHWAGDTPTIDDVIQAQRDARRQITRIREKAGQA